MRVQRPSMAPLRCTKERVERASSSRRGVGGRNQLFPTRFLRFPIPQKCVPEIVPGELPPHDPQEQYQETSVQGLHDARIDLRAFYFEASVGFWLG